MSENRTLDPTIDFIAGTMAGVASLVVGFPFDTVKVRFQNPRFEQHYSSTMNGILTIVREEKFIGLFKGISSPLAGVAFIQGLVFASYRFLLKIQLDDNGALPTMTQIALAGIGCGAISSIIATPTELIKIRQQSLVIPTSAWQIAWDIYNRSGIRGLYRGLVATILREFSYGAYFCAYEATCRYFNSSASFATRSPETSLGVHEYARQVNISSWMTFLIAGAVAGIVGWMSTFPFDVIKTRMQGVDEQIPSIACPPTALPSPFTANSPLLSRTYAANAATSVNPYRTMWSTIVNSYRSEGIQVFYKGLSPALIRAIPVNMATFVTFEAVVYALS